VVGGASDHVWHSDFLEIVARRMKPAVYLELGVGQGLTFDRVKPHCGRAVGVDRGGGDHQMLTDEFFAGPGKEMAGIELAFIDSDHRSAQAFRDFCNVIDRTVLGGLVCLHDTYPENESQKEDGFCSDSYRVPEMIRRRYGADCEVVTFPFPPGLTVVRRVR